MVHMLYKGEHQSKSMKRGSILVLRDTGTIPGLFHVVNGANGTKGALSILGASVFPFLAVEEGIPELVFLFGLGGGMCSPVLFFLIFRKCFCA